MRDRLRLPSFAVLALLASAPAGASFHEMQIEQALGGRCGDPAQQAIQLRMRIAGQTFVAGRKLIAYDAQGSNPIELLSFPDNVTVGTVGSRILITTAELAGAAGITPDFTLTARIPDGYLKAGKVTFEDPGMFGFGILWSLAWGGGAYMGGNAGSTINDPDGNFGTAVTGPLPFSRAQAITFQGPATAPSSTNDADYQLAPADRRDPVTLTRNDGTATVLPRCFFADGFVTGDLSAWSAILGGP